MIVESYPYDRVVMRAKGRALVESLKLMLRTDERKVTGISLSMEEIECMFLYEENIEKYSDKLLRVNSSFGGSEYYTSLDGNWKKIQVLSPIPKF